MSEVEGTDEQVIAGRYELRGLIGAGGTARVYRALDRVLRREVAIKILTEQSAADASYVARFRREARAAAGLSHRNIVTIYDWGETSLETPYPHHTFYMVMELMTGGTVKELIERDGPLSEERALTIAGAVASALEAAHRAGIIHRDVKPQNVLLIPDGQVKISDFGIARGPGLTQLTETNMVSGTVQYLSPEQARGAQLDQRSDIYSLGVSLYEMLAGRPPFTGHSPIEVALQHLHDEPPPLAGLRSGLSPSTQAIVARSLAKDPANRYADMAAMRSALSLALASEEAHATEEVTRVQSLPLAERTRERTARAVPVLPPARTATRGQGTSRLPVILPTLLALLLLIGGAAYAGSSFLSTHHGRTSASGPRHRATRSVSATSTPVPVVAPRQTATSRPVPTATSAPQATNTPVPTAPTPVSVAAAPNTNNPKHAVTDFYQLISQHDFASAAALWSSSMRQSYPPSTAIDRRFSHTSAIWVRSMKLVNMNRPAGMATVAVDVVEQLDSGATQEFVGTWNLVLGPDGWRLNSPDLRQV